AIAAAVLGDWGRRFRACAGGDDAGVQPVHAISVRSRKVDAEQLRRGARVQAEDVAVGAAAAQVDRTVALGGDRKAPNVGIEAHVRGDVGHTEVDAPKTRDHPGWHARILVRNVAHVASVDKASYPRRSTKGVP